MRNIANSIWIWREYPQSGPERRVRMRRSFELPRLPEDATVSVSANSCYLLYANGIRVGRGPARSGMGYRAYDSIDLRPYLRVGRNTVAALVYRIGIPIFTDCNDGPSGFWMDSLFLKTDETWKVSRAPGYPPTTVRHSHQLGFQEHFDARSADGKWTHPEYDDSDWDMPVAFENPEILEPRGIPRPSAPPVTPGRPVASARWPLGGAWRTTEDATALFCSEFKPWTGGGEPGFTGGRGMAEAKLYELGTEVYGQLRVRISAAADGVFDFQIAESVTGFEPDIIPPEKALAKICFGNRISFGPGETEHEFTMPLGFRYLAAVLRDGGPAELEIEVLPETYPLEIEGRFRSSDPRLEAVWNLCRATQQSCMADAYMDCPWREQTQWWGDARIQAQNTFRLAADTRLFERGIRQVGRTRAAGGLTNAFAPARPEHDVIPGFSLTWVCSHYDLYFQTGSRALYEENRLRIDEVMEFFHGQLAPDGLLHRDPRFWLFIDWCPELFVDGASAVYNLQYLEALRCLAELSGESRYTAQAVALERAVVSRLLDRESRMLCDGIGNDGQPHREMSPHTAAMAVRLGIAPELHGFWAERILLPLVRGGLKTHLQPTSYFMFYIFDALKKLGFAREVVECIRNWWGNWLAQGYATTPESWMIPEKRGEWSCCHAWSAHPLLYLSELVLGVRQLEPGWKRIAFEPLTAPGAFASGVVPTPHGNITVSWDRRPGREHTEIHAPRTIEVTEPITEGEVPCADFSH